MINNPIKVLEGKELLMVIAKNNRVSDISLIFINPLLNPATA